MLPHLRWAVVLAIALAAADVAAAQPPTPIKVFLDCPDGCFADYLRDEIAFVDYVRDRQEADIHALVTRTQTGGGGREYTVAFIGAGRFQGVDHTLKAVTTTSDTEDRIRRQLATTVRAGLLRYLTRETVPPELTVSIRMGTEASRQGAGIDPWKNWVFSLRGSASMQAEETQREKDFNGSLSADRITPDWKTTFGGSFSHQTEKFDLDEDEPVTSLRRSRSFRWLIVKALGEHWSAGGEGSIVSSTFSNTSFSARLAPAIEFNVFPYSAYTRRQLRIKYSVGASRVRYFEETLFGKTRESLANHQVAVRYEQREPWGSLEVGMDGSQYLHDFSKGRIEANADLSWRIIRGLSVTIEANASRIRDQLSLPRRGATAEEIFLRLRQLRSGYEVGFDIGFTYSFGSIFSSVVNPRFGQ